MAVHGAAARMMQPAMYWSASAGLIHGAKKCRKKSQAIKAIENGFTSQFTNSVIKQPARLLTDVTDRAKIDLHHHRE